MYKPWRASTPWHVLLEEYQSVFKFMAIYPPKKKDFIIIALHRPFILLLHNLLVNSSRIILLILTVNDTEILLIVFFLENMCDDCYCWGLVKTFLDNFLIKKYHDIIFLGERFLRKMTLQGEDIESMPHISCILVKPNYGM